MRCEVALVCKIKSGEADTGGDIRGFNEVKAVPKPEPLTVKSAL